MAFTDSENLISIIIPAYNRRQYLPATLESCLTQTYSHLEIIVVDDGSTDDTASVAEEFSRRDARITVIRSANQGQCAARNLGLSHAHGKWIKFLDSDDLLPRQTVERQLNATHQYKVPIVSGSTLGFWDHELPDREAEVAQLITAASKETPPVELTPSLYHLNLAHPTTFNEILITRELVQCVQGFDTRLRAGEEFNLMLRLSIARQDGATAFLGGPPVLLKRYANDSMAVIGRTQKKIPWILLSLQYSAEFQLSQTGTGPAPLKSYIFGLLYHSLTDAYYNGLYTYGDAAWEIWQLGNEPRPRLPIWYQDALHSLFIPRKADRALRCIRWFRDRLRTKIKERG